MGREVQKGEDIYIYTYIHVHRFMLMFDRRKQNSVKQLSFNLKKWKKKPTLGYYCLSTRISLIKNCGEKEPHTFLEEE